MAPPHRYGTSNAIVFNVSGVKVVIMSEQPITDVTVREEFAEHPSATIEVETADGLTHTNVLTMEELFIHSRNGVLEVHI